jgi:hypothetical protein
LREHDAIAALPLLSLRRPLRSLRLLVSDRTWLLGFATESTGFVSYAAALALAPSRGGAERFLARTGPAQQANLHRSEARAT